MAIATHVFVAEILPAQAQTETQVLEKLKGIPVFTITDDKGSPLLATVPKQGKNTPPQVVVFFLNPTEAQATISQLKKTNPAAGNKARVVIRSLAEAYDVIRKNQNKKDIAFQIVPAKASLDSARTILVSQGKPANQIPNVPVFFAMGGKDKKQGLLTLEQNGKQVVPFFFDQKDLQKVLDLAKKQQSSVANTTKIQVVSLPQVLNSMIATKDKKPSPETKKFTFFPATSALQYVAKNQPTAPKK
jgi:hypothetical protein